MKKVWYVLTFTCLAICLFSVDIENYLAAFGWLILTVWCLVRVVFCKEDTDKWFGI